MIKKTKKISTKEKILNKNNKSDIKFFLEAKKIAKDASAPEYMLSSDVGLDLKANENVGLKPMEQKAVRTGIIIKIPDGHVGLIRDRSGIVKNMNVHTVAGTFDPDYRGEVSIILINLGDEEVEIEKGMRIAQMIILPVTKVEVKVVQSLSITERGSRGFGSTGISDKIKLFKELEEEIDKQK